MPDHYLGATATGRRRRRATRGTTEGRLRTRLHLEFTLPAVVVGALMGSTAVAHFAALPSRLVWSIAAFSAVLCVAALVIAWRRAARVARAVEVEREAYLTRLQVRANGLEKAVDEIWSEIGRALGEDTQPAPARPALTARPEDPFDRVQQAMREGQDRVFKAVEEMANRLGSLDRGEQQVGVFVNVAKRMHSLILRILTALDAMEAGIEDPDLLNQVFRIDHLTTQARRQAENLGVLFGETPRRALKPVPITIALRHAVQEVVHYTRVRVMPVGEEYALPGTAVTDIVHLLAELIENATKFSPPHAEVVLTAERVHSGVVIEVDDRGLHMRPETRDQMNRLLAAPDEVNLSDQMRDGRIGLLVAARLAKRNGVTIELRKNIFGGTTALVLIPTALLKTPERPAVPAATVSPASLIRGGTSASPTACAAAPLRTDKVPAVRAAVARPQGASRGGELPPRAGQPSEVPPRQASTAAHDDRPLLPSRHNAARPAQRPTPADRRTTGPAPGATPGLMGSFAAGIARAAQDDNTPTTPES